MITTAGESYNIVSDVGYVYSQNYNFIQNLSPQEKYDLWKSLDDAKDQYDEYVKYTELRNLQKKNKKLREMVVDVKFSGDRTIVFFNDGTKTIVQCQEGDTFDKEKGLAVACMKKLFDNTNIFNEVMRKWCHE